MVLAPLSDSKIKLNTDLLSLLTIGWDRLKEYYTVFLKEGDLTDPSRPEVKDKNGVSLKVCSDCFVVHYCLSDHRSPLD